MKISAAEIRNSLTDNEFNNMLDENMAIKGILVGYIAEQKLIQQLSKRDDFLSVTKIPDRDSVKGDILVQTKDRTFTIEVKCLGSSFAREDILNGGISSSVSLKMSDKLISEDGITSSCPLRGQYDILAICLVTVTGKWDFQFIHNKYLPLSIKYPGRIQATMSVNTENTPCLHLDLSQVLADLD